ncbi:glycosyl transferase family 1 [Polycladomyces subterraneus]|uniref:Glycosyl transferase family 1 n=1 Tax=Polycladomyces subterraneus TaxID=1016997 RepID=A0ABT8IL38_9BACL|nr:glycosyl transferase family 1 [Polycladomyces subterraneus]MDN4593495.1 glycosyl transferase family 1 [Polycladomyces subterraneus]
MAFIICPRIPFAWSFMKQRPQQLMTQFGKLGHKVFVIQKSNIGKKYMEVSKNVTLVSDHGHFITKRIPLLKKRDKIIVWTHIPRIWHTLQNYQPDGIVFDCIDEFTKHLIFEHRMVGLSKHVVCTAKPIYDRLKEQYPNKPVSLIRNGADLSFFSKIKHKRPVDLPKGPIVGYIGSWAKWIDFPLMDSLCKKYPNVNFVVIGAKLPLRSPAIPNIRRGNLHLLGHKQHHELLSYIQHFDVAIIPFLYNQITLATNPVKAYEYLAGGARVLSTALPECIAMEPYIQTATTHSDFINKLGIMLKQKDSLESKQARINFAARNTWEVRARKANIIIEEIARRA